MNAAELNATAGALVPEGKGILAADESHPSIARRFAAVGVENTAENRRLYRQMFFTTKGVAEFISGVILYDETIRQAADDGTPLGQILSRQGILPGIVFLSGGQREEVATAHLNAMNAMAGPHPWQLSFSYGRALQAPVLEAWRGDPGRIAAGQQAFYHRARCNGAARSGRYTAELERAVA